MASSNIDKMTEEAFGKHVLAKFNENLSTKAHREGTTKMFGELLKLTSPSASTPLWTTAEEDRGQSSYTCTDSGSFSDPSLRPFKAWMVTKLRYIKDGIDSAKFEVIGKIDQAALNQVKAGMDMFKDYYTSHKVQNSEILHVFGLILHAKA